MDGNTEWNKPLAMQYFAAYSKFVRKNLKEGIQLNSADKLRGKIGSAEFEYNDSIKLFIVRGLIDKEIFEGNPKFKELLIQRLTDVNKNPPKSFKGALLEIDKTAFELDPEFPERLNLRKDYRRPIEIGKFIKEVDKLTDQSYIYSETDYSNLIDEVNKIVFPDKD
jgi:hypothetical protein